MLSNKYINFIKNNESLIRENRFEEFYNIIIDQANDSGDLDLIFELGTLTDFLMEECDINLFSYLDELPTFMFAGSGKTDVVIPDKYDTIPVVCFMFSQIEKIKLPEGLREIEANAFNHSNIREIRIPSTVILIAPDAFAKCKQLTKISISENTMNSVDIASLKINENGGTARVEIYK